MGSLDKDSPFDFYIISKIEFNTTFIFQTRRFEIFDQPNSMSSKSDKQRRARRIKEKFAKKIILRALQRENWDLQDVGNLVSLLLDQLHLDDASDVFKFVAL